MQRVLITGAGGFVGRHCVPLAAAVSSDVHAVMHTSAAPVPNGVRVHRVNLLDPHATTALFAAVRPTHLLHLAWNATPGEFWATPDNLDWVAASLRLVRAFVDHGGRRCVVAGTCAEYEWSLAPLHETRSPLRPATLYGASKLALGQLLSAYANQAGVSLGWGRLFGLYGPHEHPRRLVAATLRALLSGTPVVCTAGSQERDFLHVADAASALVTLLASPLTGAVNIASGSSVSIKTIVEQLARQVGGDHDVRFGAIPAAVQDPPRIIAETGRLQRELNWKPARTLAEGLAETTAWWCSQREFVRDAA